MTFLQQFQCPPICWTFLRDKQCLSNPDHKVPSHHAVSADHESASKTKLLFFLDKVPLTCLVPKTIYHECELLSLMNMKSSTSFKYEMRQKKHMLLHNFLLIILSFRSVIINKNCNCINNHVEQLTMCFSSNNNV